jgi:hypothetical protein
MKGKIIFYGLLALACCRHNMQAEVQDSCVPSQAMNYGETAVYDVYFKWGPIMSRAGDATFSYDRERTVSSASSRYSMQFKTAKFFDGFFKMRDTLKTYYNDRDELVYSLKCSDDGGYYSVDQLTFHYNADHPVGIHSRRYTHSQVKIDTALMATGHVTDLLGTIYYLRRLDRTKLQHGKTYPLTVAIGRDLVEIRITYRNQSILERGNVKYSTHYFVVDISDDAFESTKTSAEIWMGDDENFLPVKVRSKLKIGYAEIHYRESSGLAHPLSCRIEMPR